MFLHKYSNSDSSLKHRNKKLLMEHLFKKKVGRIEKVWKEKKNLMSFTFELKDTVKQQQLYTTIYTTCTDIFSCIFAI